MANVTDPLARSVHGTNPQNLVEYITRQKIYDSLYWKEECFGLSAVDVVTKASELKALGGSYGGNNKPTRFLCLALKLLQIQPEDGIVEELLQNEDFKYVRALGAFYMRLTGRPAEIYECLEPLYNDFRKLRFRHSTGWKITYVDELADELLNGDRYCGIALPHLPKREVLVNAGYLDGPRRSAMMPLIEEKAGGDAEAFLQQLADGGNVAAKAAMEERKRKQKELEEEERKMVEEREGRNVSAEEDRSSYYGRGDDRYDRYDDDRESRRSNRRERDRDYRDRDREYDERYDKRGYYGDDRGHRDDGRSGRSSHREGRGYRDYDDDERRHRDNERSDKRDRRDKEKKSSRSSSDKKYGSLFKKTSSKAGDDDKPREKRKSRWGEKKPNEEEKPELGDNDNANVIEGSAEYWNEQRAKLGLKPLKD